MHRVAIPFVSIAAVWLLLPTVALAQQTIEVGEPAPEAEKATLVSGSTDGTAWETSESTPLQVQFPAERTAAPVRLHAEEFPGISMSPTRLVARDEAKQVVLESAPQTAGAERNGSVIEYAGLYPQATDRFEAYTHHLKHALVLEAQPSLPAEAESLAHESLVVLDNGLTIEPLGAVIAGGVATAKAFYVRDGEGKLAYVVPPPVATDANGRTVTGHYRIVEESQASLRIASEFPVSWLAGAAYPVELDPTFGIGDWTSTGGGGSNYIFTTDTIPERKTMMVIDLNEMTPSATGGYITEMGIIVFPSFVYTAYDHARVTLGETSRDTTNWSSNFQQNFDQGTPVEVIDGPFELYVSNRRGEFVFDIPFDYSGNENLAVMFEFFDAPIAPFYQTHFRDLAVANSGYIRANSISASTGGMTSGRVFRFDFKVNPFVIDSPPATTDVLPAFYANTPYTFTMTVDGTTSGSVTWSASGLPSSLSIDPNSGEISGTPDPSEIGQQFTVTIEASDNSDTHERTFTIEGVMPPEISTSGLALAAQDVPYSFTMEAEEGVEPYSWAASGLPNSLTLNSNGEFSGTPEMQDVGTHTVDITVEDANGVTDSDTFVLDIRAPVQLIGNELAAATELGAYSEVVPYDGGSENLIFSADGLPQGLEIDPATGVVGGSVEFGLSAQGPYDVDITVEEAAGTQSDSQTFTLVVNSPPRIATTRLPWAHPDRPYSFQIEVAGGTAPITLQASGLPESFEFDEENQLVSEEVTEEPAEYEISILAVDANNVPAFVGLTLRVQVDGGAPSDDGGCGALPRGAEASPFLILLALIALGLMSVRRRRAVV